MESCTWKENNSIYFESKQRYGSPRMKVELLGESSLELQWLNI
jgi:hypothetical protein